MMKVSDVNRYGLLKSIRIAASKYLGITVMKMHYLINDINIGEIETKLKGFDLDVKELKYEDFLKGDRSVFQGKKLELYKFRCNDCHYKAYGIIEEDELIYSTWYSVGSLGLPMLKSRIPIKDEEGLLEDSYCAPKARGRGFHSRMNMFRLKKLYEEGKRRVIVIVLDGNEPAMKVQLKSGFKEIGVFYVCSIFGFNFTTLNKARMDCFKI